MGKRITNYCCLSRKRFSRIIPYLDIEIIKFIYYKCNKYIFDMILRILLGYGFQADK